MKSSLLSTLTLAAALAVAGVSFAKAEDAAVKTTAQIDRTATGSIQAPAQDESGAACQTATGALCIAPGLKSARYPVNALEGLNLGY